MIEIQLKRRKEKEHEALINWANNPQFYIYSILIIQIRYRDIEASY